MGRTALSADKIESHVRRASELGVPLSEYAEAYDVDLEELEAAQATAADPLSDFVAVTVVDAERSPGGVVCRLVVNEGWSLECLSWPPASWLRTLGGGAA